MKKSVIGLTVLLLTGVSGLLWAEEETAAPAATEAAQAAVETAAPAATEIVQEAVETADTATIEAAQIAVETTGPVEVNNTICPLSGRELKLGEEEIAKLEFEGRIFNVCPMAKAIYDQDPSSFAEKLAQFAAPQMDQMHAQMQVPVDAAAILENDTAANAVTMEAVETTPENVTP